MENKVLSTVIQFRRGTEAQWEAIKNEFVPAAGEPCVTLDGNNAGQIKIGDGITPYGALAYAGDNVGVEEYTADEIKNIWNSTM